MEKRDFTIKQEIGVDNLGPAQRHLDNVSEEYFEAINKCDDNEFLSFKRKLEPIYKFSTNPRSIVSVGVGGGLELRVLADLFKDSDTRIIGIDLSQKAIKKAGKYLVEHKIKASLVQSSAIQMPFKYDNCEIGGIVLSAVMHEVYSYVDEGKSVWKKAVLESVTTLSDNGILLLRDFAGPSINDFVEVSFLNEKVRGFYNYFRQRFRTFKTWDDDDAEKMKDKRLSFDDYPPLPEEETFLRLPFGLVAEMVLHFKNYNSDLKSGLIKAYSNSWKEIDERYLIPDPDLESINIMDPEKYKEKVLECSNQKLRLQGYKLECLAMNVVDRPETNEELKKYFSIKHETHGQDALFKQITSKMELVFKKSKI
ncbi:TPA: hypothetical protein DEP94_03555 [Candidatus Nomurabacteria bacterium]|nr:hypothetical protein [Candidatus Nomurabacteria bacterium]